MEYTFFNFKYIHEINTDEDEQLFYENIGQLLHKLHEESNNKIEYILTNIDFNGNFTIKMYTEHSDYFNKFDDDDFEYFKRIF